jgi:ankyrin repeat protein
LLLLLLLRSYTLCCCCCFNGLTTLCCFCCCCSLVNIPDGYGLTPLHYTVWFGHLETTRLLLMHDALLNVANSAEPEGLPMGLASTPLHLAAFKGSYEACQEILLAFVSIALMY